MDAPLIIIDIFLNLFAQTGKIAPVADILGWYETAFEKAMPQQTGQPLAVGNIGFPTRYILDMASVYQNNFDIMFQNIMNRPPIDSRTFHCHYRAIVSHKPISQSQKIFGNGAKFSNLGTLNAIIVSHHKTC